MNRFCGCEPEKDKCYQLKKNRRRPEEIAKNSCVGFGLQWTITL